MNWILVIFLTSILSRDATKSAEERWQREREEFESRIRECVRLADTVNMHLHMAVAAKAATEKKVAALSEQKRVLVKEVKILQRRLLQESDSNQQLKEMNEKLCSAAVALQDQLNSSILSSLLHQENFEDSMEAGNESLTEASDANGGADGGDCGDGNQVIRSISSSISAAADALQDILLRNVELASVDPEKDEPGVGMITFKRSRRSLPMNTEDYSPFMFRCG